MYAARSVLPGSGNSSNTGVDVGIGESMRTKLPVDVSEGVGTAVDDSKSEVRSSSADSSANGRAVRDAAVCSCCRVMTARATTVLER